jgi:hypothetical protein
MVAAALAVIPNPDLSWDEWGETIGMATWASAEGSDEFGWPPFNEFSRKSKKYDERTTRQRWLDIGRSPPTEIGFGTLVHLANQADPTWRTRYYEANPNPDWVVRSVENILRKHEAKKEKTRVRIAATPFEWIEPEKIPPRQWLYQPYYIRKFTSATISPGGRGKTSLLIAEALAMATGWPLLGVQPVGRLRCWYWNGEDHKEELDRRIAAACKFYGITKADLGDRLFRDSGMRGLRIKIAEDINRKVRIVEPMVKEITRELIDEGIDVLTIDPFISSHGVSENDNMAIDRVAKTWGEIGDQANCAIMLAHHARKTGGADVTTEDSRGASALGDAVRMARALNFMSEKEAERAEIPINRQRYYFRCDSGKVNLTPPAESADWFHLASVDLCNGPLPYGAGGDSIGVVTPWQFPQRDELIVTWDQIARVQAEIKDGRYRADQRAVKEPWVGVAVAKVLGLDLMRPLDKKAVAKLVTDWLRAGYLDVDYVQPGSNPGVGPTPGSKR